MSERLGELINGTRSTITNETKVTGSQNEIELSQPCSVLRTSSTQNTIPQEPLSLTEHTCKVCSAQYSAYDYFKCVATK